MGITDHGDDAADLYAPVGKIHAGSVSAALVDDLSLIFDAVSLAALLHGSYEIRIADNRRITDLDADAAVHGVASLQVAGVIVSRCDIHSETEIRLNPGCSHFGTAAADFLLNGEYIVDIIGISTVVLFQGFQKLIAADTVVQGAGATRSF